MALCFEVQMSNQQLLKLLFVKDILLNMTSGFALMMLTGL